MPALSRPCLTFQQHLPKLESQRAVLFTQDWGLRLPSSPSHNPAVNLNPPPPCNSLCKALSDPGRHQGLHQEQPQCSWVSSRTEPLHLESELRFGWT